MTARSRLLRLMAVSLPVFAFIPSARADIIVGSPGWSTGAPLTGPGLTTQWDIAGTDLGIPWLDNTGRLLYAFGDSFTSIVACNPPSHPDPGLPLPPAWVKGGTLGWADATSVARGSIKLDGMLTGPSGSQAIPMELPGSGPQTVVPSGASAFGSWDVVAMDGVTWCSNDKGEWQTSNSDIYWRNSGTNQQFAPVDSTPAWDSASNFASVALLVRNDAAYPLYILGTPAGRQGGVKLARVTDHWGLVHKAYEYWDGTTWESSLVNGVRNATAQTNAAWIVPPPAGELSVQFNAKWNRYVITYFDVQRHQYVMRDAPSIEGPYTEAKVYFFDWTNKPAKGNYGGFALPFSVVGDGSWLTTTASDWCSYNIFFTETPLAFRNWQPDNVISDGGFENQSTAVISSPWRVGVANATQTTYAAVDSTGKDANSGTKAAFVTAMDGETGWHDVHQTVAVQPYATYELTFHVRAFNVAAGYAGARTSGPVVPVGGDPCNGYTTDAATHSVLGEQKFGNLPTYTTLSVRFTAGASSLAEVYAGFWANGSYGWILVDDISMTPLETIVDRGFEMQPTSAVLWPYATEGTGPKGIDNNAGFARTGTNNAWIRTAPATTPVNQWNAIAETIAVAPGTNYVLTGYMQTSSPFPGGYFGVRDANGKVVAEVPFAASGAYEKLTVNFPSGNNTSMKVYAGYYSNGSDDWLRLDDLSVLPQ